MTMAMSFAHRISGVALYAGVLLLAWFLIAASADASSFAVFSGFIESFIGRIVLFVVTWALFHHLIGAFVISFGMRATASMPLCAIRWRGRPLIGGSR
jgi:succinate dehydrogenase cytochrome b556 subunit